METVGSLMERMRPKTMHAVTAAGFEWNVFLFVLAYSLNCLEVATWVNLRPFGQEPECGHENTMLSGRTIYVIGSLQLVVTA